MALITSDCAPSSLLFEEPELEEAHPLHAPQTVGAAGGHRAAVGGRTALEQQRVGRCVLTRNSTYTHHPSCFA